METALDEALSKMILSASGWRGVFAENGDEESPSPDISHSHTLIAAAAANIFLDYISSVKGAVIVGRDTRPTGKAVADAVIRALLSRGRELRYTGVAAAPEIMAYARALAPRGGTPDGAASAGGSAENTAGANGGLVDYSPAAGFIYISASHNPIGHNGIKFGLTDGGVLQADETMKLVSAFKAFMASPGRIAKARSLLEGSGSEALAQVYAREGEHKKNALASYRGFTEEVISGLDGRTERESFFSLLKSGLKKRPLGIAADFNGSARTVSIDREFLTSLGAGFHALNDVPGKIAHRIVPEGESLLPCRAFLEELHGRDSSVILGYVPDCDGDRGNLVIWDDGETAGGEPRGASPGARILEAQEVFALACVAELSSLVRAGALGFDAEGKPLTKAAIAVNDPTSLRIERIAEAFGVRVFRAEVGESNVVGLARRLREEGYLVRILGEGSSGGTITYPSAVRDPIDTLGAILKLLAIRSGPQAAGHGDHGARPAGGNFRGMGLFEIWCTLSGQKELYREDFTPAKIIASLPAFITTGAYTDDALLKVKSADHALLKERYQKIFERDWEKKKDLFLRDYGFSRWEAVIYRGMEEKRGVSRFSEAGRGGLKIEFARSGQKKAGACVWMRGSGTEPVFRIMADAEGSDPHLERALLDWQRQMVVEADGGIF